VGIKFAYYHSMPTCGKRILIIDNKGFCNICYALLKVVGYGMETSTYTMTNGKNLLSRLNNKKIGLIVTSYPYSHFLLPDMKKSGIPFIILSDSIDNTLMRALAGLSNSYCMIKPIDYQKFRGLVMQIMDGYSDAKKGFSIV
jgi:hypothetical protein